MSGLDDGEPASRKLRILLIAYEFLPSPSPQSLRWAYLTGRLARLGHEVHVMAPEIRGSMAGLPELGPAVRIHKVYPGPVRALLGLLGRQPRSNPRDEPDGTLPSTSEPPRLNWKGRLGEALDKVLARLVFPDARGEWKRPALRALVRLLEDVGPDVVVSSHEPSTTIEVGRIAKAHGFPWLIDLGDPVLTGYTSPRWQPRALALERHALQEADHVMVTAVETERLLRSRHKAVPPISVVEQGFDDELGPAEAPGSRQGQPLELLYSGRFYSFRNPAELVAAVLEVPGVRLSIASGNVPEWLVAKAREWPRQVRLLGSIPHRRLLEMQRNADVLVNIANQDAAQVPGKFYEYLGSGRPVLHVRSATVDAAGDLVSALRRGWSTAGDRGSIAEVLAQLDRRHAEGQLEVGLDLSACSVGKWSWTVAAARTEEALRAAVAHAKCGARPAIAASDRRPPC